MLALAFACHGLLLGGAPVSSFMHRSDIHQIRLTELDPNSPAYRAKEAAKRTEAADNRRTKAAELGLSGDEVIALDAASKSLQDSFTGTIEECPQELINKFSMKPLDLFAALRNPQEDPHPAVWTVSAPRNVT